MTTTTIKAYVTLTNGSDIVTLTPGNAGNNGISLASPNIAEDMQLSVQDPINAVRVIKGSVSTTSLQLQEAWTGATVSNAVVRISTTGAAVANLTQSVRDHIAATGQSVTDAVAALNTMGTQFTADLALQKTQFNTWKAGSLKNLDPASGRFFDGDDVANKTVNRSVTLAPAFAVGVYQAYNSSTVAQSGKFIHGNSTNGGAGAALAEPASSLVTALKARGGADYGNGAYGVEYYIARVTQGSATVNAVVVSGQTYYLSLLMQEAVPASTLMCWIRAVTGSVHLYHATYRNGVESANAVVNPADGWVHLASLATFAAGYTQHQFYGTTGSVFEIAMPVVALGDARGMVHLSPVRA